MNDYLVPGVMLASCLIPGPHQVATIPAAYGMVAVRLAPVIGRVALAYGTVDTYNKATTFLNEKAKHGGNGKNVEPSKERIVETKQTQQDCWEQMKQSGEWERKSGFDKPTLENKKTGDLAQKSIEKWDIEVFGANKIHKGVIRPSEGFLRNEFAVKGRKIQ